MPLQSYDEGTFGLNLTQEQLDSIDTMRLVISDDAMKALVQTSCRNCGTPVIGHIANAGLVIDYAGYKFCSDVCLENWVDEQGEADE